MEKKIKKPWGYEILFAKTAKYAGKVLCIRQGEELSFQYHKKKMETIFLFKGSLKIIYQKNGRRISFRLKRGKSFHIPPRMKHRFSALEDSFLFEVSTPHLKDVVRLEDKYNRIR